MCARLGVELIGANSPQPRVKKMRLQEIATYEEANRFLRDTYLPQHNAKYAVERLFPALADRRLNEVTRDHLQAILDEKAAADLSFSVVDHLKWDLNQEAKRPVHTSMRIEEVIKCLAVLEPRERLIVRLAVMAEMRPGILRELDNLPIEYRWNTRAVLIDPEEARGLLDMHRKKWRSKIRGWKDQIFKTQSGAIDIHAQQMATDAEEAMGVAASGDVQFAQYSANIICLDEDPFGSMRILAR